MSAAEHWYWLSTRRMTVGVCVRSGIVVTAPPIVRKFLGQSIDNLRRWMQKQPGYRDVSMNKTVNKTFAFRTCAEETP